MKTQLEKKVTLKAKNNELGVGLTLEFEKGSLYLTNTIKDSIVVFDFLNRGILFGFQIEFSDSIINQPMTDEEIKSNIDIHPLIKDGFSDLFTVAMKNISLIKEDLDIVAILTEQIKDNDEKPTDVTLKDKKTNRLYIVTIDGEPIPNVKVACELLDIDLPNVYKKLKKQEYHLSQIINFKHLIIKEYEG